ncbi:MAG TPA: hypothetical protein VF765_15315 [Polyangiaceae bacterium]
MGARELTLLGALLLVGACASRGSEGGGAASPAAGAQPAPAPVEPAALLGRSAGDAEILLRLSVARGHPLGGRLEPFILAWPGWGKTIRRISPHPVAELDWIDVVGPRDADKERLSSRTSVDDAVVDTRLAQGGDGTLRVVVRSQPHLVTASPPASAPALAAQLRSTRVLDPPAEPDEGLRADVPDPHALSHYVPQEARRALVHVYSRPGGAAEARAELTCDDPAAAQRAASSLRGAVDGLNGILVRMLTHDLLSGLSIDVSGPIVRLRLPASREQLEALATLASGMLPQ